MAHQIPTNSPNSNPNRSMPMRRTTTTAMTSLRQDLVTTASLDFDDDDKHHHHHNDNNNNIDNDIDNDNKDNIDNDEDEDGDDFGCGGLRSLAPRVWSSLPHDLLHNILSRIPVMHSTRLRTVCKAWNQMIVGGKGRELAEAARPGFAVLVSGRSGASASAPEILYLGLDCRDKWRRIGLDFLPERARPVKFLASSAGLLLLGSAGTGELWVANPVTRASAALPAAPGIRGMFYWAIAAADPPPHFTVVLAESEMRESPATAVYDSRDRRWRRADAPLAGRWRKLPSPSISAWGSASVPVFRDPVYEPAAAALYHVTWDPIAAVSEFNVDDGVWRCRKGGAWAGGGGDAESRPWGLMNMGGKVVMVKLITGAEHCEFGKQVAAPHPSSMPRESSPLNSVHSNTTSCIPNVAAAGAAGAAATLRGGPCLSIWELDTRTLEWSMASLVPPPPAPRFRLDQWRQFAVGAGCVLVAFIVPGRVHTWAGLRSEPQPAMLYDCTSSSWLPIPDVPAAHSSSLFSFTPSYFPL